VDVEAKGVLNGLRKKDKLKVPKIVKVELARTGKSMAMSPP
jgi:hypothetical protein